MSNAWTPEQVAAHLARFDRAAVSAANVEQNTSHEPAPKDETQEVHSRFSITVHHRSRRVADAGGRSHKAAMDGIVRGGILPDDSTKYVKEIKETYEQRIYEATVIEIWRLNE